VKVTIDGLELEVDEGETVEALAKRSGIKLGKGCIVAIRKQIEAESVQTNLFNVMTTRGRMVLRMECVEALEGWRRAYKRFEGINIRWSTKDATVIGPILSDFEPSKNAVELKQGEITLSLSGFSNENTHLVLSKKLHSGSYAPPKGCGVLGRVVYGKHILGLLRMGDKITKIEPIVETKIASKAVLRASTNYKFDEPVQIYTCMKASLDKSSPLCSEHAYNVFEPGNMEVTRKYSRFIACDKLMVTSLSGEKVDLRKRGTITVRNSGTDAGSLYVYLVDAPVATSHTIIGEIAEGMELAEVALVGDLVAVSVSPRRLDILGKRQTEAAAILDANRIKMVRSGDESDDAIIAQHEPQNTLEIYSKGQVDCFGISQSQVVKVRFFYDKAPNSIKYFKIVTGLELRRFGKMKVYFTTPKMEMVLFKGDDTIAKGLLPENTPEGQVMPGAIGLTNSVKKFTGMMGVRFFASSKFGPTAEGFDGTNIIGKVTEGIDVLKGLREGMEAYVVEVN